MGSILAGSTALGRFFAGIVLKKLNWFYVLIGSLSLAALLVLIAMPLAKNEAGKNITGWLDAPIAAYIFPLIGLLLAPVYPAINSVILSSLPKPKHGVMSGLIIIFSAIGGTTGSLITGYMFDKYSGQTAFYFTLVPIGILIICLAIFKRLQKKPVAEIDLVLGYCTLNTFLKERKMEIKNIFSLGELFEEVQMQKFFRIIKHLSIVFLKKIFRLFTTVMNE